MVQTNLIVDPITGEILEYDKLFLGIRSVVTPEQLENYDYYPISGVVKSLDGSLIDMTKIYQAFGAARFSSSHNHDDVYSKLDHNHDENYSAIDHHHNEIYCLVEHKHDDVYSKLEHTHDENYSPLEHKHDESYSPLEHKHDDVYSLLEHNHNGEYIKRDEHTPNRIIITNENGSIIVKDSLNASQLDHLKNVSGDIQSQLNSKSFVGHEHEEYLTLEKLKDVNFSGVAEDIVYNPENSNLESTNVRDAIDEVDDKIEQYIDKLVEDKKELKEDIANTNESIGNLGERVQNLSESLSNKADKNHTHDASEHIHTDLIEAISNNSENISNIREYVDNMKETVTEFPDNYATKSHTHQDLQSQIDAINTDITDHRHTYLEEAIAQTNENVGNNAERIQSHSESITSIRETLQNKADKDHTHDASDHVHQDILDRIDGFNEDFAEVNERISGVNERITDEVENSERKFAPKEHTHTEYAPVEHTHDFRYEHNHDGIYAPAFHLHNNYADVEHYHNDIYASKEHTHTGEFAPTVHTHGDLANKEHTHNEFSTFELITNKNKSYGYAGLDGNGKIPLSIFPDVAKSSNIIGTKEQRETIEEAELGTIFRETDTGDSYIYDGSSWVILADSDWANVSLNWSNIEGVPTEFTPASHTHTMEEITDLDVSNHTHEIEDVDGLTELIEEIVSNSGSNTNKEYPLLDTETEDMVADKTYYYSDIRRYNGLSDSDSRTAINYALAATGTVFIPKDFTAIISGGFSLQEGNKIIGEDKETSKILTTNYNSDYVVRINSSDVSIKNVTIGLSTTTSNMIASVIQVYYAVNNTLIEDVNVLYGWRGITFNNNHTNTKIKNVSITINREVPSQNSYGIYTAYYSFEGLEIDNVNISNAYYGLYLYYTKEATNNISVKNSSFYNSVVGSTISISSLMPFVIENCTFKKSSNYHLSLGSSNFVIRNCHFENDTKTSAITLGTITEGYITDCTFYNCSTSINANSVSTGKKLLLGKNNFIECDNEVSDESKVVQIFKMASETSNEVNYYPVLEVEGTTVVSEKFPYGHMLRYYSGTGEITTAVRNSYTAFGYCYIPNGTWTCGSIGGYLKTLIGESKEKTVIVGLTGSLVDDITVENITFYSGRDDSQQSNLFSGACRSNITFRNVDFINITNPIYSYTSNGSSSAWMKNLTVDNCAFISRRSSPTGIAISTKEFLGETYITNCRFENIVRPININNCYATAGTDPTNIYFVNNTLNGCTTGFIQTSAIGDSTRVGLTNIIVEKCRFLNSKTDDIVLPSSYANNVVELKIADCLFNSPDVSTAINLTNVAQNVFLQNNKFYNYDLAIKNVSSVKTTEVGNIFIGCTQEFFDETTIIKVGEHNHDSQYSSVSHTHLTTDVFFEDGTTLQDKIDEGSLGGSSSSGDCNVIISTEAPTNLPIGGIWIDISNL